MFHYHFKSKLKPMWSDCCLHIIGGWSGPQYPIKWCQYCRHLGAQRRQVFVSMLSVSHQVREETVRRCLAVQATVLQPILISAFIPRFCPCGFPRCLKYAFVLMWYKADASAVSKSSKRSWAVAESWQHTSCHNVYRFGFFRQSAALVRADWRGG